MMKSLNILPNLGEEASRFSTPFYHLSPIKTGSYRVSSLKNSQEVCNSCVQPLLVISGCWKMLTQRRFKQKRNSCPDWVLPTLYYMRLLAFLCIVFYFHLYTESVGNPDWGTLRLRQPLVISSGCKMSLSPCTTSVPQRMWRSYGSPLDYHSNLQAFFYSAKAWLKFGKPSVACRHSLSTEIRTDPLHY